MHAAQRLVSMRCRSHTVAHGPTLPPRAPLLVTVQPARQLLCQPSTCTVQWYNTPYNRHSTVQTRHITSFTPPPTTSAVNHRRGGDDSGMDDLQHHHTPHTQAVLHNPASLHDIERAAKRHTDSSQSAQQHHTSTAASSAADSSSKTQQMTEHAKDKAVEAGSRLKQLWHQYGYVAIATYLTIYVSTLFSIYLLYHFKLINFDPMLIVRWLGVESHVAKYDPKAGEFALAWITTKLTEPVRIAATAMVTPTVARFLGRAPSKAVARAMRQQRKAQKQQQKQTS